MGNKTLNISMFKNINIYENTSRKNIGYMNKKFFYFKFYKYYRIYYYELSN
jgi:hypothetical protein